MTKKLTICLRILLLTILLTVTASVKAQDNDLYLTGDTTVFMRQLIAVPGVSNVQRIQSNHYTEKYVLQMEQNVDGDDSSHGTFNQRVVVGLKGLDRPTVLVTEGYDADYSLYPFYEEELAKLFNANLIVCQYRYFGESAPTTPDGESTDKQGQDYWQYMTVDNSLRDYHHVRQALGSIFSGKWISTGISKGGQTTMFYRATYPNDMDVSVSYVAPLNRAVEDGRHEKFLAKKVGTKEEREVVAAAQQELMNRKDSLMEKYEDWCERQELHFNISMSDVYDFCVMEYPFALWQWGTPTSSIPAHDADNETWFKHFTTVSSPDYFECPSSYVPFFVQAAHELGYYGYSNKGLKKQMSAKKTKNYLYSVMLPEQLRGIKFDKTLYKRTVKYLKENDPKHIFIYGEIDPWTSSGVADWLDCSKKQNMRVFVQPRGSHKARIGNMPDDMKAEIMSLLTKWLSE